jgi:hypothetical protein
MLGVRADPNLVAPMDVTIIIPVQASETKLLAATLAGALAQHYEAGRIEIFAVRFRGPGEFPLPPLVDERGVLTLTVDHPSSYAARNAGAARASGEALLFTEPGCVPDPGWVRAHVEMLQNPVVTVSIGLVVPARSTRSVDVFLSYENVRDAWVFSCPHWQHYFGRPKNMAVARRRFETHGPFIEVMRGADSKFIQRVARELSCAEVGLAPAAVVRQQSIRGLLSCYQDRYGRGHVLRASQSEHAAPISLEQRIRLFRRTVEQSGHGALRAGELLALLGMGLLAFRLGRWTAAVAKTVDFGGESRRL